MNTDQKVVSPQTRQAKLSALWIFVMFNMAFADIFSFMYPGFLKQIVAGNPVDGTQVTAETLLIAALIIEIPISMVLLSRVLPRRPNRWANIVAAIITIPWVVAGGSMILHYIFFATVEILGCLAILWLAWTWRAPEI